MAFRKSATLNEENYITIKSGKIKIIVVQVVGFMARRIRCWVDIFDRVEMGQKIGMLIFGSGTRLIMPKRAKILVREKQKVKAGETIVAKLGK
jgi:phosphatidylserine decarboxylase